MTSQSDIQAFVKRNYRFNFVVNALDGTFFWCGASFIAANTILPLYVSRLTDSKLALGILSTIAGMGWLAPQLFTANWVQRLPRKKVIPVNWGLFLERLPVLLMAPAVWLLASRAPLAALIVFLLLYAWHAGGAGLLAVAWQDMIGKIIPLERRGFFMGITNFGGTATGVLGATAAAWMLTRFAFPTGYALAFASAGVLILISWGFLALTREPAQESQVKTVSQVEYLQQLPAVLRADPNFRAFLISRVVLTLSGMATGFLAVYATQRWALSDGQAGVFTASTLIGQAVCNLLFGFLADRKGHKLVLEIGYLGGCAAVGLAAIAAQPGWFYGVFALIGAATAAFMISGMMIALEFSPPEIRPTYIGLNNTIAGLTGGLAPLIGGGLAELIGYRALFALAFGIGIAGVAILHWAVREPRYRQRHDGLSQPAPGEVE